LRPVGHISDSTIWRWLNQDAIRHECWEIETALDEIKTHLRGAKMVLRSKQPDLVRKLIGTLQNFIGRVSVC
jgi:hypothetical protein